MNVPASLQMSLRRPQRERPLVNNESCSFHICRFILLSLFYQWIFSLPICAAEPYVSFLNGLRSRGYLDTALEYLDRIESQPEWAADDRQMFLFQRGLTLQMAAEKEAESEVRHALQKEAAINLEKFIRQNPDHDLSVQARHLHSELKLQLASTEINASKSLDAADWLKIREEVQDIRNVFQQVHDLYRGNWERFPAFVPEDQPELRRSRNRAEEMVIRALLDLAQCDYWEGRTYMSGSPEQQEWLNKAALAFEAIHQRYRSQVGGLYARLWQGRCYQERGDDQGIRLALGIFGELLEHDGIAPVLIGLKDRALLFRLICLNGEFRRDYQLVEMESEYWLETAGSRVQSEVGLNIKWELCRALEMISLEPDWAADTREDFLIRARELALQIESTHGGLRLKANEMLERISRRLLPETRPGASGQSSPARPPAAPLPIRISE